MKLILSSWTPLSCGTMPKPFIFCRVGGGSTVHKKKRLPPHYAQTPLDINTASFHEITKSKMQNLSIINSFQVKSTQYKKLAPNALRLTYQNLKSFKSHEKNETKNIRFLVYSFSAIDLVF